MLFYILIASSVILGAGFLYSLNKNYRLKLELKFLAAIAEEDKAERLMCFIKKSFCILLMYIVNIKLARYRISKPLKN